VWGSLLRRMHTRVLFVAAFGALATGTMLMLLSAALDGAIAVMYLGFFVWGFGFGGGVPLSEYIWARYYGRRYIGAVRSVGVPLGIVFGASGSLAVAKYFDVTGSYTGAFVALAVCYVLGALTIFVSREPPPKVLPADVAATEAQSPPLLEATPAS
jgi:OFA family oxalate/formate antiporter-like MFS transporter